MIYIMSLSPCTNYKSLPTLLFQKAIMSPDLQLILQVFSHAYEYGILAICMGYNKLVNSSRRLLDDEQLWKFKTLNDYVGPI